MPNAELADSDRPFGLAYAHMFNPTVGTIVMGLMIMACIGSLFGWQFTIAEAGVRRPWSDIPDVVQAAEHGRRADRGHLVITARRRHSRSRRSAGAEQAVHPLSISRS